jgi:hypothetical protein
VRQCVLSSFIYVFKTLAAAHAFNIYASVCGSESLCVCVCGAEVPKKKNCAFTHRCVCVRESKYESVRVTARTVQAYVCADIRVDACVRMSICVRACVYEAPRLPRRMNKIVYRHMSNI